MAAPIDIFDIISPVGYSPLTTRFASGLGVHHVSSKICHNYILQGSNDCPPSVEGFPVVSSTIYLEIKQWDPIEKEEVQSVDQNEAGDRRVRMRFQKRYVSATVVLDQRYLNQLYGFEMFQVKQLVRDNDINQTWDVEEMEVSSPRYEGDTLYTAKIRFRFKNTDYVIDSCCGSAFSDAPYEDGDTDSGGGPAAPAECDGYTLDSITMAGDVLTANTSGVPTGATETFSWYYFETENSPVKRLTTTAQSLTINGPGTYRAVGQAGVCQTDPVDFLVQDDCASVLVTSRQENGYIIVEPNRAGTISWERDIGAGFVPWAPTGLIVSPDVSGDYRYTFTVGDCDKTGTETVTVDDCSWSGSIAMNVGVLEFTLSGYTGAGTATYQWRKSTSNNEADIIGATASSHLPDEQGLYVLLVTLDGCEKRFEYVVLSECLGFRAYIDSIVPSGSNVQVSAGHLNAPGPVDIKWYQHLAGQWTQIGSGTMVTTSNQGAIKLEATSEGCVAQDYSQADVDPNRPEYEQRIIATAGQQNFNFNLITLPDKNNLTEKEIGQEWELYRNGVRLLYMDSATDRSEWDISGSNYHVPWPSKAGDEFILIRRHMA